MERIKIENKVIEIYEKITGREFEKTTTEEEYKNIIFPLTEKQFLKFYIVVQMVFGIEIPFFKIKEMETLKDLVDFLENELK